MIIRSAFRCVVKKDNFDNFAKEANATAIPKAVLSCSIFSFENQVFAYWETDGFCDIEKIFVSALPFLESWNGKAFQPMMDIFHSNRPQNKEQWKRSVLEGKVGVLARLKNDGVAPYIYYHYQSQEEVPGRGHKYGIIHLHENYIFFYKEKPLKSEPAWYERKLTTDNSPFEQWHELMDNFFDKWKDTAKDEEIWRSMSIMLDYTSKDMLC